MSAKKRGKARLPKAFQENMERMRRGEIGKKSKAPKKAAKTKGKK